MHLAATHPGQPEIFRSIQGEGASQGRLSTFVRLARCNLHCVWCDTPYTWNYEGTPFAHRDSRKYSITEEVVDWSPEQTAQEIVRLGADRVVVTGGEPLLQQDALIDLCRILRTSGAKRWIEIETNATIAPKPALDGLIDQYNCSPKLSHSGNDRAVSLKAETLAWFARQPRATFKFVVSTPDDLDEIEALIAHTSIPRDRVWLMPEGVTSQAVRDGAAWLVGACTDRGFHFSDRLHIHLFGHLRGV